MIFLLNRERVLSEIMELATLQISKRLNIPESKVHSNVELDGDRIKPSFGIDGDVVSDDANDAIGDVWGVLRVELTNRLLGLNAKQYGYRN